MTNKEAISWLLQPGIQMIMNDPHTKEAVAVAIKAMNRQIPVPYKIKYKETVRVEIDTPEDVDVFTFHCPCCDQELGDSDWDGMPDADWLGYCDNCGQRIDWKHEVALPSFERKKASSKVVGFVERKGAHDK